MMWLRWTLSKLLHAQLNRRTYFEFMERKRETFCCVIRGVILQSSQSFIQIAKFLVKQSFMTFGFF
jgi:hypothetical protein